MEEIGSSVFTEDMEMEQTLNGELIWAFLLIQQEDNGGFTGKEPTTTNQIKLITFLSNKEIHHFTFV